MGCCLAGSSSGSAQQLGCSGPTGHPSAGHPAPQQPGDAAGPTELDSPAVGGLEGAGSQAVTTEVPISIGEPGMKMQPAGDEPQVPSTQHPHSMDGGAGAGCPGVPERMAARAEPSLSLRDMGNEPRNTWRP